MLGLRSNIVHPTSATRLCDDKIDGLVIQPAFVTQIVIAIGVDADIADIVESVSQPHQFKLNAVAQHGLKPVEASALQVFACSDILEVIGGCGASIGISGRKLDSPQIAQPEII